MIMKKNKKQTGLIWLLPSALVMGGLLIYALTVFFDGKSRLSFGGVLRTEIFLIIAGCFIVIPIILLAIWVVILSKPKKEEQITYSASEVIADGLTGLSTEASADSSDTAEETSTRERFCMLSEIDRKSSSY